MPELRLNDTDQGSYDRFKLRFGSYYQLLKNQGQSFNEWLSQQPTSKRIGIYILMVLGAIGVIMVVIFHAVFIKLLILISQKWRDLPYGGVILFILVFFVGFPPILGFSSLSILCGMVYDVFPGWLLLSTASISGSFASFLTFRYLLRSRAEQLLKSNEKFKAFAEILKQDQSLMLLILIRLCPLPYSLSNGALASIPELSPITYLLASVLTSPKLFIHIFVGHQLIDIGDSGNTTMGRIFDAISLVITACASATTMYIIYDRMQKKLDQFHANSYHDENIIFGNFDDDDESGNNLELESTDFDADNFIIEDEPEPTQASEPSKAKSDFDDDFSQELDDVNTRSYRDY